MKPPPIVVLLLICLTNTLLAQTCSLKSVDKLLINAEPTGIGIFKVLTISLSGRTLALQVGGSDAVGRTFHVGTNGTAVALSSDWMNVQEVWLQIKEDDSFWRCTT